MTEQQQIELLEALCLPNDPRLDKTIIMGGQHYEWISDDPDEECVRKIVVCKYLQ